MRLPRLRRIAHRADCDRNNHDDGKREQVRDFGLLEVFVWGRRRIRTCSFGCH